MTLDIEDEYILHRRYFKEELAHGGNAGLSGMVDKLEPLHAKFPGVSYADIYTLGGKVAIEAAQGPTIPWKAGRVDALTPDAVTPDGRLPAADKGSPDKTLYTRPILGFLKPCLCSRATLHPGLLCPRHSLHHHTPPWAQDVQTQLWIRGPSRPSTLMPFHHSQ